VFAYLRDVLSNQREILGNQKKILDK
jgi:hypothetical protein